MSIPQVSIAMAICNVERFLPEAMESILAQTFTDFECIIVDFGSADNTKAIVSSYIAKDTRIRLYEISNCDLAEARNKACSYAQGKYIAVMDADDVCLPERLQLEVAFMEKNPEMGLVGGATEWIDAKGRSLKLHSFPSESGEIKEALQIRFPFCHPTMLIRRTAFAEVGGYRKPFVFAHDYDLAVRMTERFRCSNLKQVVLKYRIHPHQVSLRKQQQQTLCRLAAQASVPFRRSGKPDPLDKVDNITSATLVELGVPEKHQRSILAADGRNWIRSMVAAGEYSVALDAASDMLKHNISDVESWQIADLYLTVAQLYWKQSEFLKAFVAAGRALTKRPFIVGRPVKVLLHRVSRNGAG